VSGSRQNKDTHNAGETNGPRSFYAYSGWLGTHTITSATNTWPTSCGFQTPVPHNQPLKVHVLTCEPKFLDSNGNIPHLAPPTSPDKIQIYVDQSSMSGINTALDAVITDLNSRVSTTGLELERVTASCGSGPRCISTVTTTSLGSCGYASWSGTPDTITGEHTGGMSLELDGSWPTWNADSLKRTLIHELIHFMGLDNYTSACGINAAMIQPDFTCSSSATSAYTMTVMTTCP
jgi:hypothetical protein